MSTNSFRQNRPRQQRRLPPSGGAGRSASPAGRRNGATGNARQNYERYVGLAREAALAGDLVQMEHWYQHAEHYYRVMNSD